MIAAGYGGKFWQMFACGLESLFALKEGGRVFVFRQQHNGGLVPWLVVGGH
jgi:hypothetical protein